MLACDLGGMDSREGLGFGVPVGLNRVCTACELACL